MMHFSGMFTYNSPIIMHLLIFSSGEGRELELSRSEKSLLINCLCGMA